MNIIVCIDDGFGMLFNNRRVSSDKMVLERISKDTEGRALRINRFSEKLFEGFCDTCVGDDFLSSAESGDYCFVETVDITEYKNRIEKLIVYRWNRAYPSDFKLPFAEVTEGMKLESSEDFLGNSHKKITREVYSR